MNSYALGLILIYLTVAILLLAVAIIAYPTLKDRNSHSSKKAR